MDYATFRQWPVSLLRQKNPVMTVPCAAQVAGIFLHSFMKDGFLLSQGDSVLYFNPPMGRILGIAPGETRATSLEAIAAFEKAQTQHLPVAYCLKTETGVLHYRFQVLSLTEGQQREFSQIFLESPANTLPFKLLYAQDITGFKEMVEAKDVVLASLAHEIRTPLTSLTMSTRLLKRVVETPHRLIDYKNLIISAVDDVDRFRSLLEELLVVAKNDGLSTNLDVQNVNLGKLIQHLMRVLKNRAQESNIAFVHELAKDKVPLFVEMDPVLVTWALSHLVISALRQSAPGGKVWVGIKDSIDWVEFRVIASVKRAVEKSHEVINPKNADGDLDFFENELNNFARAKEMILAHGGRIWLENHPSHDLEIRFSLPKRGLSSSQREGGVSSLFANAGTQFIKGHPF